MKYLALWSAIFAMGCQMPMTSQEKSVPLWPDAVPNAIKNPTYQEQLTYEDTVVTKIYRVTTPTLTMYRPERPNGTAIVICPGGGYQYLSAYKEGQKVAEWLNTLGITAFVLKYRLPADAIMIDKSIGPLQDAQEAMRLVRRNAKIWGLRPDRVGIMGFSAGGHLAATLSTHFDMKVYDHDGSSARPDFAVLVYPVISMKDSLTHKGSKKHLLGDAPSDILVAQFSNETQVDSLTPPTFLVHAVNDTSVPDENSVVYAKALYAHGVICEIHLYKDGGHGFGLGRTGVHTAWPSACEAWLKTMGL